MAFQEQVAKLVERLTELSAGSKVEWEETADEDTFQAPVSKFVVTVGVAGRDRFGSPSFRFRILDQRGKMIEEATRSEDNEYAEWSSLQNLHELARRHALHVDEALSELLSSLDRN